ncbi:MAG: hypothetical protein EOP49_08345, partial [Sphingobacteriales bacterium]
MSLWKNGLIKPILRNTFLNFEKKGTGIIAGNIIRNYEMNFNGKGLAVYREDRRKENRLEAGYITSGTNLIRQEISAESGPGATGWLQYNYRKNNLQFMSAAIADNSAHSYTQSGLIQTELNWTNQHQLLSLYTGGSYARDRRLNGDEASGYAGGITYNRGFSRFYFTSSNYYSSPQYAGFRRGAIICNERLSWNVSPKVGVGIG